MASSQWNHLLDSNDPPLDADIPVIRHLISEKQTRLEVLDSEIQQLLEERKKIANCIQQLGEIAAPIRRLPTELLAEIFSHTSASFTRRVQTWRELALHSPFLWRRITFRNHPEDWTEISQSKFEVQLIRSGTVPLDISLDWQGETAGGMALLDLLISQCHRWGAFHIKIRQGGTNVLPRLRYVYGQIPLLKEFGFIDLTREYDEEQEEYFLSQAPCLREITLTPRESDSSDSYGSTPRFHVPWAQIAYYSGSFSAKVHLDVLAVARNLVVWEPLPHPGRIVSFPHLHRLRITEDSCVLDHMTAPSLEELILFGDRLLIRGVPSFIDRSCCDLTKLVLDGCPLDLSIDLFQSLPYLTDLIFINSRLPDGFWDAMTLSDIETDLCPDLETLVCHWGRVHDQDIHSLHTMMSSRNTPRAGASPLSLRLFYGKHFPDGTQISEFAQDNPQFDVAFLSKHKVSQY